MFALSILIVSEYLIGYLIENEKKNNIVKYGKYTRRNRVLLWIAMIILILFSGLRTSYNDTGTYIQEYKYYTDSTLKISFVKLLKEPYYGFQAYKSIIKFFFHTNYHWLFLITAIIVNVVYMREFLKHAVHMELVLVCYIVLDPYMFSNAAVKQVLAMSIAVIAIEKLLENKYKLFFLYIILAYTFHPYILLLAIAPLLKGDVWSKKIIIIFVVMMVSSLFFERLIGFFLSLTENIGKDYDVSEMLDHTINPMRVLVDFGPVILSYICRKNINKKGDDFYKLSINMYMIFAVFSFASLFGNPIFIHRTGQYFSLFCQMIVPWMLTECISKNRWKNIIIIVYLMIYIGVFYIDLMQLYVPKYGFFYNFLKHVSILELFK